MRILKPPTPIYDIADGRTTDFKSMKDIPDHRIGKIDSVVFSEEGMAALQTEAPETVYVMSTQYTNEVEWEHYAAMRELISSSLKYVDHSLENFMKAMVDADESLYNHILKEHENGDRKVKFTLTGESELTLEEDLEHLDRAYQWLLVILDGYIYGQQHHDGKKIFQSTNRKKEDAEEQEYRDTAVSMMERAQKKVIEMRGQPDYTEGVGWRILWNIMKADTNFMKQTKKYFA